VVSPPDPADAPARPRRRRLVLSVGLAIVVLAAGTGYHLAHSSVQTPQATVSIPVLDPAGSGPAKVLPTSSVSLKSGQTFQIQVGLSDGPIVWRLTASGDGSVVRQTGQGSVGSCAPQTAGCRVPALYTYTAQKAGTTAIVWEEQLPACQRSAPCYAYQKTVQVTVS
jgi:hypothetical protein